MWGLRSSREEVVLAIVLERVCYVFWYNDIIIENNIKMPPQCNKPNPSLQIVYIFMREEKKNLVPNTREMRF